MDRWAIMAAYYMYSVLWGGDGATYANQVNNRLHRLRFKPASAEETLEGLSPEAKRVYGCLELRHHRHYVAYNRWHRRRPDVFPPWPGTASFPRSRRGECYCDWVRSLGVDPACLDVWGRCLGAPGEDHTPSWAFALAELDNR
jgi:hypothetical protein